jgi:thiamine kinase-like enzyme
MTLFQTIQKIPSFENQVTEWICLLTWKTVFVKKYTDEVKYKTESTVLRALSQVNQSNIPIILDDDSVNKILMLSRLPWDHFDSGSISALWKKVRELHESMQDTLSEENCGLKKIDYPEKFNLFRSRILWTPNLNIYFEENDLEIIMKAISFLEKNIHLLIHLHYIPIHADLKPENILMKDDEIYLLDFESSMIGTMEGEISRMYWRILWCNNDQLLLLIREYWAKPSNDALNGVKILVILDCLGALSYFLYKGYKNNYPFHKKAIETLFKIL